MSQTLSLPPLKKGDTIGVFAPSSWVEKEDIEKSKNYIEQRGYKVFIHPQTYERENQSAGTHLQKALAFQGLWQRHDISAIWAAGGGNRCTHLIDTINFSRLNKTTAKPLIGFSDVTSLLNAVYAHTQIPTIHGPVFKNLYKHKELDTLLHILEGKTVKMTYADQNIITPGQATGTLVGGNLSLFQYLPQTLPNDFTTGTIIFLEDCNEELSRIDRMILHLKRLGVFAQAKAIAFGQFSSLQESGRPFGYSLRDIISEHTQDLDIPVLHDLPFGHGENLFPLPIGAKAQINTQENSLQTLHTC